MQLTAIDRSNERSLEEVQKMSDNNNNNDCCDDQAVAADGGHVRNAADADADYDDDAIITTTSTSLMRQKLMFAEEVYLYKIPPLKTAGGHRCVWLYVLLLLLLNKWCAFARVFARLGWDIYGYI